MDAYVVGFQARSTVRLGKQDPHRPEPTQPVKSPDLTTYVSTALHPVINQHELLKLLRQVLAPERWTRTWSVHKPLVPLFPPEGAQVS